MNDDWDDSELVHHYEAFHNDNPFQNTEIMGDNLRLRGRTPCDEVHERDRVVALRDILAHRIQLAGIARPSI